MRATNAQLDNIYTRLPVSCDVGYTSIAECLSRMPRLAKVYTLVCGYKVFWEAKAQLQLSWQNTNPFCPVVNVSQDPCLEPAEWYISPQLENVKKADCWGSEGVS